MKNNKKNKDVIWPIRMKESLKNQFKDYCDNIGYSMNKRIKILIEMDMINNKVKNEKINN